MKIERNVVYGMYSGLALLLDVHFPDSPNGYGIVFISGSGWRAPLAFGVPQLKHGSQFNSWGRPLVEHGYTVFSINHRAIPRFAYPAAVQDVQRAVRFIRQGAKGFGISAAWIGALGGSSGGHLVSMLGVLPGGGRADDPDPVERHSARVQCVVARAAVVDLRQWTGHAFVQTAYGGEMPATLKAKASPLTQIDASAPPFLLIHGDADEAVSFDQSERMALALASAGVEHRLIRIVGGGHGPDFPGAVDPPDYIGAAKDWFDAHLPG